MTLAPLWLKTPNVRPAHALVPLSIRLWERGGWAMEWLEGLLTAVAKLLTSKIVRRLSLRNRCNPLTVMARFRRTLGVAGLMFSPMCRGWFSPRCLPSLLWSTMMVALFTNTLNRLLTATDSVYRALGALCSPKFTLRVWSTECD